MADVTPREKAEEAVYDRIAEAAKAASPEDLEKLGNAVARMKFGPDGGASTVNTEYNYNADYHTTHHDGEEREKPDAGFGPGER